MLRKYQTSIGSFTRKSTFFWASVGATVGLANLWQFPYLASIHGGGLFILLYLACLLIVTLPLMVTEAVEMGTKTMMMKKEVALMMRMQKEK